MPMRDRVSADVREQATKKPKWATLAASQLALAKREKAAREREAVERLASVKARPKASRP